MPAHPGIVALSGHFRGSRPWHGIRGMMYRNRRVRENMRKRYSFTHLSRSEREFLESVLAEEVEIQSWYAVSWSRLMGTETIVSLQ
jgi:hypothetical protein